MYRFSINITMCNRLGDARLIDNVTITIADTEVDADLGVMTQKTD